MFSRGKSTGSIQNSLMLLTGVMIITLATLVISPQHNRIAVAAAPTDIVLEVYSNTQLSLYTQPSRNAPILRPIGKGNRLTWNGAYQNAEGRNWMFVEIAGQAGWISPDNDAVGIADPTRITPGIDRAAVITPATNPMSLYQAPGRGSPKLGTLPVGTQLRVYDGPVVTDLYTWWPVQVLSTGQQGWVVDTASELQVLTPLTVYGIQVCDNFDLKTHGVPGWEAVRQVFPTYIPRNENIVCLASTNMRGSNTPVVVVLTRGANPANPFANVDTLRIFEPSGGSWLQTYTASGGEFNRTERLSLHDFPGSLPILVWAVRVDGTGGILNVAALRYGMSGITPALLLNGIYKGSVQINAGILSTVEAVPLPNEPNCCLSTARRIAYQYDAGRELFIPISDISFLTPLFAQGRPAL